MSESPSTSGYPTSLDTWTTLTDKEDLAEVSDINKLKDAMLNVQTELGTDPAGSVTDLTTRLGVMIGDDGAVKGGTSFPGTPTGDQLFVRTDEDILYRRNTGDTAWLQIGGGHSRLWTTPMSATTNSGNISIEPNKIYKVIVSIKDIGSADTTVKLRVNSTSSANYDYDIDGTVTTGQDGILLGTIDLGGANNNWMLAEFLIDTNDTNNIDFKVNGQSVYVDTTPQIAKDSFGGYYSGALTITDFEIVATTGNMTGTVYTYEYLLG